MKHAYVWILTILCTGLQVGCSGGYGGNNGGSGGNPTPTPTPMTVAFAPNPPFTSVASGGSSQTITVTVTNDTTAGGVTTALLAGSPLAPCPVTTAPATACGTIAGYQQTTTNNTTTATFTYTPPASVPMAPDNNPTITVTAKGVTTPSASFSFTITPPAISVSLTTPPPATIVVGTSVNIVAHVANDPSNKGVDWSLNCGTGVNCGTIASHTASDAPASYTAPPAVPGGGGMTITATATADPTKSFAANVIIQLPADNTRLRGQYAFEFNGFDQGLVPIVIAGYFVADGNGNITGGLEDVNRGTLAHNANVAIEAAPASTYNIQTNGRGTLNLATALGTARYDLVLDSKGNGKFIEIDVTFTGSGLLEKQDSTAFSAATLSGSFAIGLIGNSPLQGRGVLAGEFQADGSSKISGGRFDTADITGSGPAGTFSGGSFTVDTSTGHGTIALDVAGSTTVLNFAIDIVSSGKIYAVELDGSNNSIKAGLIRKQIVPSGGFTTASLSGNSVFTAQGAHQTTGNSIVVAGVLNVTMAGTASGVLDGNVEGIVVTNSSFSNLSYAVTADGRGTASIQVGTDTIPVVFYLYDLNSAFLIEGPSTTLPFAIAGDIVPQSGAPFAAGTPITLTAGFATETPDVFSDEDDVGLAILDATGNFSFQTLDQTTGIAAGLGGSYTGSYTLAASGRGTASVTSPTSHTLAFYMVSPTEFVLIATVDNTDTIPVLIHASQ